MPRYIMKVEDRYFEYSTIVDAPVTEPMTLDAFTEYYKRAYGAISAEHELPERMARVEAKGTSSLGYASWRDTVAGNVAGWAPEDFIAWVRK